MDTSQKGVFARLGWIPCLCCILRWWLRSSTESDGREVLSGGPEFFCSHGDCLAEGRRCAYREQRYWVTFVAVCVLRMFKGIFFVCLFSVDATKIREEKTGTVHIAYRVTGYNDLPDIMIGLTKIKIKTSKMHSKYHYIQCILAVVIYRI